MPFKKEKLEQLLKNAAYEKDQGLRTARVAAVISQALNQVGFDPILVGGSAVTFYTKSRYTTADIDMVSAGGKELQNIMFDLGFEKHGKDYLHPKLKIYVEFPSSQLRAGEKYNILQIAEGELKIISLEDLIIDRMNHFKYFKSTIDGLNVIMLLESPGLDMQEIEQKATLQDVKDALYFIQKTWEKIVRKKLSVEKATELLKSYHSAKN